MATGPYDTTYDAEFPFSIPEFYIIFWFENVFNVDIEEGNAGIGYVMIIGNHLMVKLYLKDDFECQILKWYKTVLLIQEPGNFLGKPNPNQQGMQEVVMQTEEPYSRREPTVRVVRILEITYTKSELDEVDVNSFQVYANKHEKLLGTIKEFDDLFDGNLGERDTLPIRLEAKPRFKPFIDIYDLEPRINK